MRTSPRTASAASGAGHSTNAETVPLGILAGGSGVPCEIAAAVTAGGRRVHIVGIDGEAEPGIADYPHTLVNLGGIGAMLHAFKSNGCGEIVIIGRVRRPNLLSIRPDLGFWASLPALLPLLRGGDDAILRLVVGFFERHGLAVIGAHEAAPDLIAPAGVLGKHAPSPAHRLAIAHCSAALAALGPFDAAQAAVADTHGLLAVEGADGTDAMLRRLADPVAGMARAGAAGRGGGVLVKLPKHGQERRIDLPAIGPETMRRAAAAGLAGVAVASGQTLFAERARAIELADTAGLFVLGTDGSESATYLPESVDPGRGIEGLKTLARRRPSVAQRADAEIGARILDAVDPFWPRATVAVSRGYVLATEGPGGAIAAVERAGRLKPWGMRLLRRRSGVLAMTDISGELGFDATEIVRRARASSLAGIVILRSPRDEAALAALRAEADRTGLFVMAPGDAR